MGSLSHSSHSSPNWPGQNTAPKSQVQSPASFSTRTTSHPTSSKASPSLVNNSDNPHPCQSVSISGSNPFPHSSAHHSPAKSKPQFTSHHHRTRHFPSPLISVMSASHQPLKNPPHLLRTPALHFLRNQSFFLRPFAAIPPAHKKPRLPHGKRGSQNFTSPHHGYLISCAQKMCQSSRLFRSTAPGFTLPSSAMPSASRIVFRVSSL